MKGIDQYSYYQNIRARLTGRHGFSHTLNGVSTATSDNAKDKQARSPSPIEARSKEDSRSRHTSDSSSNQEKTKTSRPRGVEGTDYIADGRGNYILTEAGCYEELGFSWSSGKKWSILWIVFLVQVSMNFNTSLYSNAIPGMQEEFGISAQAGRVGAMLFLICYAFGCEIWAPWSEDFGRWPIMQFSLLFVNLWQLPVALAQNYGTVIIGRILGGFSSAGGSVTLAMVADLFEPENQQRAVAFVVFSSVGGSVLGPVVGGFSEAFLHWRWSIWLQLIFGGFVQVLHLFFVPETRSTVLVSRIAQRRRLAGEHNLYGPTELVPLRERFTLKEIGTTWIRPFQMFVQEPIVLVLSLLSGFSDALIFMFIQSFGLVYARYHFSTVGLGLSFIPIVIGYFLGWGYWVVYAIPSNRKKCERNPDSEYAQYEHRLFPLLWTAPFLPVGLMIFAWTSTGPPIPWIASSIGAALVGIANYAIYMGTIDYMITAYGPYSASATGGNGWARDFLAGCLTMAAVPMYKNIGSAPYNLAWPSLILSIVAGLLVLAVFVVYRSGEKLRKRSKFAQQLGSGEDPFSKSSHPIGRTTTRGSMGAKTHPGDVEMQQNGGAEKSMTAHDDGSSAAPAQPSGMLTPRRGHVLARERQDHSLHAAVGSRSYTPRSSAPGTREHSPVRRSKLGGGGGDGTTTMATSTDVVTREESRQHARDLEKHLELAEERT